MSRLRQRCALLLGLSLSLAAARGQYAFTDQNAVTSFSGQFVVNRLENDGFGGNPDLTANTNLVHLNTALLAVSAERFKMSIWQQLGIPLNAPWSGKIFLRLHPALSLDETEDITSTPFLDRWNYRVELPDRLTKMSYARTLSGLVLLELANRAAPPDGHTAEMPDWLVDGFARQLLAIAGDQLVLSAPVKTGGGMSVNRINQTEHGLDSMADARQTLLTLPVLTFEELSWPTRAQMEGADGGAYFASAEVFVHELLGLNQGQDKMRAMLADLPNHLNWQMAFFKAFGPDFEHPLDVEKWWALRAVDFTSRAPGPRWNTDVSLARLQELLSVPVDYRSASNALPVHADISLQDALKNLDPGQRDGILRNKVRDIAMVELRLAPPFGGLAERYRAVLAGLLDELGAPSPSESAEKHGVPRNNNTSIAEALNKLDELDQSRRNAENQFTFQVNPRTTAQ